MPTQQKSGRRKPGRRSRGIRHQITARVSPELWRQLTDEKAAVRLSLSDYVALVLEQATETRRNVAAAFNVYEGSDLESITTRVTPELYQILDAERAQQDLYFSHYVALVLEQATETRRNIAEQRKALQRAS